MPHRRISDAGRLARIRYDMARLMLERQDAVDLANIPRVETCDRLLTALRIEEQRAIEAQSWPLPGAKPEERRKP